MRTLRPTLDAVLRPLALGAAGVLLAAAAFELALALGAGSVGPQPGDPAPGEGIVVPVAFVALFVGVIVAIRGTWRAERAVSALAPATGLFVTASDYTYDPYFAPTLRRYADGGAVPLWWIFTLLAISFVVGAFTWRLPRAGAGITALGMLVWVVTLVAAGDGH
jgi:hypothetical protein